MMKEKAEISFNKNGEIYTEGFLGAPEQKNCRILFILREPDSHGKNATDFWFKKIIDKEITGTAPELVKSRRTGTRYMNIFNVIAKKILGNDYNYSDSTEFLKDCCYINMLTSGEVSMSKDYKKLVKAMKKTDERDIILANRKAVINDLIKSYNCRHIVTTKEIFEYLCPDSHGFWLNYKKNFRKGKYNDATVYEFFHPSYPHISYEKLDNSEVKYDLCNE